MRTSEQITAEIEEKFGFIPPFFEPARDNPQVLEHLWQQTLCAYIDNPLSPLFKEKLSAYLSRYCMVPYCTICHSCSLRHLGVKAREVLRLLESPSPTLTDIDKHLGVLTAQAEELTVLPLSAALEESLLYCSIFIFSERDRADRVRAEVRHLLGPGNYQHLVSFVAYVKTCHEWMEAHPEVDYASDKRAIDHLGALLEEEPALADFFSNYVHRVKQERQSHAERLAQLEERQRNQEVLRRSEERLRLALEAGNTVIWDWNIPANEVDWSDNFERVFGLTPNTFGKTYQAFLECVHPEDREFVASSVIQAVKERAKHNMEFRIVWSDGSIHWIAGQGKVLDDETGKAVRMLVTAIDITERKRVEEHLRVSEERFQIVARATNDALWDWNLVTDEVWWNEGVQTLFRYSAEQVGFNVTWWYEHIHPEDREKVVSSIHAAIASGRHFWSEEYRFQCGDGSHAYILDRGYVVYDDNGKPTRTIGAMMDITERKQAQEELQRQHQRSQLFAEITLKIRQSLQLEEILQTTVTEVQKILQADRVLVYRIWPDGSGSVVTEAVVSGWSSILGLPFAKEVFPEDYQQLYRLGRIRTISDIDNNDGVQPCLVEFLHQFGVKAKLVVSILKKEDLWGLLIVHQCSQTRQWQSFEVELLQQLATQVGIALAQSQLLQEETRRRQKLAASNAELQQFAYVASHDLQEPLRKIQAFGDRLKAKCSDALTEQGHDYVERMQNAARRMQVLIDDLLTFSRVTSQAQPFVSVDLAQVARDVLSDLEVRVQQTGGRVEVSELPTIDADPIQMRQLLQNLIGNALKFHRSEEPPVVHIRGELLKEREQQVAGETSVRALCQIVVRDNGIGFDLKYLDRIFNVFQRLHGRSEYEGTGMGLAICRKIAERHGGSITAKSTPGQGATFIVTLPVKQHPGEKLA